MANRDGSLLEIFWMSHSICALCSLVLLFLCGCNSGSEKPKIETFPVSGQLLGLDGKPVSGGVVSLRSIPSGEYAPSGELNQDGAFELATVIGEKRVAGAPAGEYSVVVMPPSTSQDVLPVELKKHYKIEPGQSELRIQME